MALISIVVGVIPIEGFMDNEKDLTICFCVLWLIYPNNICCIEAYTYRTYAGLDIHRCIIVLKT